MESAPLRWERSTGLTRIYLWRQQASNPGKATHVTHCVTALENMPENLLLHLVDEALGNEHDDDQNDDRNYDPNCFHGNKAHKATSSRHAPKRANCRCASEYGNAPTHFPQAPRRSRQRKVDGCPSFTLSRYFCCSLPRRFSRASTMVRRAFTRAWSLQSLSSTTHGA